MFSVPPNLKSNHDGLGRAEVEGREVFRGLADDEAAREADEDAAEDAPAQLRHTPVTQSTLQKTSC